MDGAHDTALDGSKLVEGISHGSQAVGGARSCTDHGVFLLQSLVVHVEHDGGKVIACRSRDDNLLGTGSDVGTCLLLRCVEACALEDYVNTQLSPRQLSCIRHGIDGDLLTIDDDRVVCGLNRVLAFTKLACKATLGCVVLEQVGQHLRAGKVIDGNYFITVCLKHLTESQTTNTAKAVDCYFYHKL